MEVDEPQVAPAVEAPAENAKEAREMERAIADLGELLERLETNPDNIPFLRRQVDLMRKLQMTDEVLQTVKKISSLVVLSEGTSRSGARELMPDEWFSHLDELIQSQAQPLTMEGFLDVFERFMEAENDYFCKSSPLPPSLQCRKLADRVAIAILSRHMDFVIRCAGASSGLPSNGDDADAAGLSVDPEVGETLAHDAVRGMLRDISRKGDSSLADSHLLWSRWRDWEMSVLEAATGDDR